MKTKILSIGKNLSQLFKRPQPRKYATHSHYCEPHMNEMPVPCGPWDIWYNDRLGFYNKVLVIGALWWGFSLALMIYTDSFYLNWGPPAQPGPPSDMVVECADD